MESDSTRELNDEALSEEITLLGELVLAASSVTRQLTQAEVDQVLELETSTNSRGGPPGCSGQTTRSGTPTRR